MEKEIDGMGKVAFFSLIFFNFSNVLHKINIFCVPINEFGFHEEVTVLSYDKSL